MAFFCVPCGCAKGPRYLPSRPIQSKTGISFNEWHKLLLSTGVYERAVKVEVISRLGQVLTKTKTLKIRNPVKGRIKWLDGTVETIVFR